MEKIISGKRLKNKYFVIARSEIPRLSLKGTLLLICHCEELKQILHYVQNRLRNLITQKVKDIGESSQIFSRQRLLSLSLHFVRGQALMKIAKFILSEIASLSLTMTTRTWLVMTNRTWLAMTKIYFNNYLKRRKIDKFRY